MTEHKYGTLEIGDDFPESNAIEEKTWDWWFPQSSPFVELKCKLLSTPPPRRITASYADWLASSNPCGRSGVYIWLLPRRPDSSAFRFVHVGMSTSSMLDRTRDHCLNQFRRGDGRKEFCMKDRIHRLPKKGGGDDFGTLGESLWNGKIDSVDSDPRFRLEERFEAANTFLKAARVVYITPRSSQGQDESIKWLEAVIGVTAANLMSLEGIKGEQSDETTNTLNNKMCSLSHLYPEQHSKVGKWLNKIVKMLPEEARHKGC